MPKFICNKCLIPCKLNPDIDICILAPTKCPFDCKVAKWVDEELNEEVEPQKDSLDKAMEVPLDIDPGRKVVININITKGEK